MTTEIRDPAIEKRAKRFWIGLVVMLCSLQLTICFIAIRSATGQPSMAVTPDYHDQALRWDEQRERRSASERLGWDVQIASSQTADAQGYRSLVVNVLDAAGNPVDGLSVSTVAFHHSDGRNVKSFPMDATGEGRYQKLVPMKKPGMWQVTLSIVGAAEPVEVQRNIIVI